jgi:hypothetical protein
LRSPLFRVVRSKLSAKFSKFSGRQQLPVFLINTTIYRVFGLSIRLPAENCTL